MATPIYLHLEYQHSRRKRAGLRKSKRTLSVIYTSSADVSAIHTKKRRVYVKIREHETALQNGDGKRGKEEKDEEGEEEDELSGRKSSRLAFMRP